MLYICIAHDASLWVSYHARRRTRTIVTRPVILLSHRSRVSNLRSAADATSCSVSRIDVYTLLTSVACTLPMPLRLVWT